MPVVKDPYIDMREQEVEFLRAEVFRLRDQLADLTQNKWLRPLSEIERLEGRSDG